MTYSNWLWKEIFYWFLFVNILHIGVDGRRSGQCSTPDGRQGICVFKRYCREATSQPLILCDDGDKYCCPIPTTLRSAPPRPPINTAISDPEPPPGHSNRDDKLPRNPIDSYDSSVEDKSSRNPQSNDKQSERPRHDDEIPRKPIDSYDISAGASRNQDAIDLQNGRPRYDDQIPRKPADSYDRSTRDEASKNPQDSDKQIERPRHDDQIPRKPIDSYDSSTREQSSRNPQDTFKQSGRPRHEEEIPRKPIDSYDRSTRDQATRNPQDSDKQNGRPRYDDQIPRKPIDSYDSSTREQSSRNPQDNFKQSERPRQEDEIPRKPIDSYDSSTRDQSSRNPQDNLKQSGRPRQEDEILRKPIESYDSPARDQSSRNPQGNNKQRGRPSHEVEIPRNPVDSYDSSERDHASRNSQDSDKQNERSRHEDSFDGNKNRRPIAESVRFENERSRSRDERLTINRGQDHSSRDSNNDRKSDEEVYSPSRPRGDNGDRRPPSTSKDVSRTQTSRPNHYPSKDNLNPQSDTQSSRRIRPPSNVPRNNTYEGPDEPIKFPGPHEILAPQPKVPACGVKPYELFIAGGEESDAHEWPWMTAIFRRHQNSRPKTFLCGGSLINTRYVLTAAHCFVNNYVILPASSFVVRLGSHYLSTGEEYTVSDLIIHHNHSGHDFFNDIALVRLASEVYITDKIAPICLPLRDMMYENLVDRMATVAGWGDTSFRSEGSRALQHVSVPIVSSEECFAAYSRVRGAAFLARGSHHVICAGLREGGKDACLGDSGGPLMLKTSDDHWIIVGIVSLGYKCAEPGYPGVYTRVTHYMSWINSNMKSY